MFNNPFAQIIVQYQKKWTQQVSPNDEAAMVRWVLKSEQLKMANAFLKLESTAHGATPDFFMTLFTPFDNDLTYAGKLIEDWCQVFIDDATTSPKIDKNQWHYQTFIDHKNATKPLEHFKILLSLLSSFQQTYLEKNQNLVLALLPSFRVSFEAFAWWLEELFKQGIPKNIKILTLDIYDKNYFQKLFEQYEGPFQTFYHPVDMQAAFQKLLQQNNPHAPSTIISKAMVAMGAATTAKDLKQLQKIGRTTIDSLFQKNAAPATIAATYLIYSGHLFAFKEYGLIDELLQKATAINGSNELADAAANATHLQLLGFQAASKHHQKNYLEAIKLYEAQGDFAREIDLSTMAFQPYWLAYVLAEKHYPQYQLPLLEKANQAAAKMEQDALKNTPYNTLAYEYMNYQAARHNEKEVQRINQFAKDIFGEEWYETAQAARLAYAGAA